MTQERKVRPAFAALLVAAGAIGMIAPAFAAQNMSANPMSSPNAIDGAHHDGDDRHNHDHDNGNGHDGHHRHRIVLVPFGFYEIAQAPTVVTVNPGAPVVAAPPPPAPEPPAAERPPCRETTADGVVIVRGLGCTSDKQ